MSALVTSKNTETDAIPITPKAIHQLSIKLDYLNCVIWKTLITPMLSRCDLLEFVNCATRIPAERLADESPNPLYKSWNRYCQEVLSWILNSISPTILPHSVGVKSSREAWVNIENTCASESRSHVHDLKQQLYSLKKVMNTV